MNIVTDIAMKTDTIVEYVCIPENEFYQKNHGMLILEILKAKEG